MDLCTVRRLLPRDDLKSTAESFKSWDTCMDNKACKIIAIVGIVLACIVGLWLIGAILTCFRQGVTGIASFVCWCCNCGSDKKDDVAIPQNAGYAQPYGQPPTVIYQPIQPPNSAYYRSMPDKNSYYDEFHKSGDVYEMEEDFDLEKQKEKTKKHMTRSKVQNIDQSQESLRPIIYDTDPTEYSPVRNQTYNNSRDAFVNNARNDSPIRTTSPYNTVPSNNSTTTRLPYPQDEQQYQNYNYYYNGRY